MTSTPDHPAHPHGLDEGWFYHRGGVEHGPLSRESLAEAERESGRGLSDVAERHIGVLGSTRAASRDSRQSS